MPSSPVTQRTSFKVRTVLLNYIRPIPTALGFEMSANFPLYLKKMWWRETSVRDVGGFHDDVQTRTMFRDASISRSPTIDSSNQVASNPLYFQCMLVSLPTRRILTLHDFENKSQLLRTCGKSQEVAFVKLGYPRESRTITPFPGGKVPRSTLHRLLLGDEGACFVAVTNVSQTRQPCFSYERKHNLAPEKLGFLVQLALYKFSIVSLRVLIGPSGRCHSWASHHWSCPRGVHLRVVHQSAKC